MNTVFFTQDEDYLEPDGPQRSDTVPTIAPGHTLSPAWQTTFWSPKSHETNMQINHHIRHSLAGRNLRLITESVRHQINHTTTK